MLRSRRSRRENYFGTWLPEPVVASDEGEGPEQQAVLADSVGLALLVVLDKLSPAERLAFVLHDMFAVPFDEIGPIIDRTPAAARQVASRARRVVRGSKVVPEPDRSRQRQVVEAFLAAARGGDFDALMKVLDPDVVFRIDSGTQDFNMPALLSGADVVARHSAIQGPRFATVCHPALINGAVGIIAQTPAGVVAVAGLTVIDGRITAIDLILDPGKLPSPATTF
jgi:RNA polymerase sigma-70 factor (ECF subfamily)